MDSIDKQELEECYNDMIESYEAFKRIVRQSDKRLFQNWQNGGFIIDDNIVTSYKNATEIYYELMERETEDFEDNDDM
jgi:uncharacterized protein YktA (UPF0223 family)